MIYKDGHEQSHCAVLQVKFLDQHKMADKAYAFAKNVFINLW